MAGNTRHSVKTWSATMACRDGFSMPGLVFAPQVGAARPGILFIAEPFGLNPEMRRIASWLASFGYVVLAPDLLARGPWIACIRRLMRDLRAGQGPSIDDLLDARTALAARDDVLSDRVGVFGLCMGGGFALLLARSGLFRVAAPFYGETPPRLDGTCPVVASFGVRDRMIAPHALHLEQELKRLGVAHDIKHYPDAGHSFLTRPANLAIALLGPLMPAHAGYNETAANDAMARVGAFLEGLL